MRRHPLLVSVVGICSLVFTYWLTAKPLVASVSETFYQHFERRGVADRGQLVPPNNQRHFGLYRPELPWDYARFYTVGQSLGVAPRIVSFYQAWGEGAEHEFKSDAIRRALENGLIPMITWEPWLSDFGKRSILDPTGCLKYVVAGNFDDYIRAWARAAVRVNSPFFVRPLHELGNADYFWSTRYGNSYALVAETYRHIVRIFRQEGAKNVSFVWTPHFSEDIAAWPGTDWVDWIGLDLFNYGTLVENGKWQSFQELLAPRLDVYRPLKRPFMIAEMGCAGYGGQCQDFWSDAFKTLKDTAYPEVKALVVFDHPAFKVNGGRVLVDWGFSGKPDILPAVAAYSRAAGFLPFHAR